MQGMGPAPGYVPGTPAKRRIHPVVWILIGLAVLLLLIVGALAAVGFYVAHQFEADPAGATAALLSTLDSDLEVVSADKAAGKLTLREKSTGKIVSLNINDLKSSGFRFSTSGGEISVEDGERSVVIGGGTTPEWLPGYAGARVKRTVRTTGADSSSGSQIFETRDGASRVLEFYEAELSKAGLKVTRSSGAELKASNDRREVSVVANMEGDGSRVILSYTAKD